MRCELVRAAGVGEGVVFAPVINPNEKQTKRNQSYVEADRGGPDHTVLSPHNGTLLHVLCGDQRIMQQVL